MPEISEEELATLKASAEEANKLKSTNQRLLEESEKNKKKAQELDEKLKADEKAKAESEGDYKKLLDQERRDREAAEGKYKNIVSTSLNEKLKNEIYKVAPDVRNIDLVLKVNEHRDLLKLDEDQLTVSGAKEYIEKVREEHPYLFGKKKMPDDGDGKGGAGGNAGELTEENYRKELAAVSTRKEQLEVMKKYGKAVDNFIRR